MLTEVDTECNQVTTRSVDGVLCDERAKIDRRLKQKWISKGNVSYPREFRTSSLVWGDFVWLGVGIRKSEGCPHLMAVANAFWISRLNASRP